MYSLRQDNYYKRFNLLQSLSNWQTAKINSKSAHIDAASGMWVSASVKEMRNKMIGEMWRNWWLKFGTVCETGR